MPRSAALIAAQLALLAALVPGAAATEPEPYPDRMASTGDSITRAFNTCRLPFTDCPQNSWSTGTSSTVNSHYSRLTVLNPALKGYNHNEAVSGARVGDLPAQMADVNALGVDYVTVLIGGNDLCTDTVADMTSVESFRTEFGNAMAAVTTGSPDALIYVVSIPDVYNLWVILKDDSNARAAWESYEICQSLLANPLSTDPVDQARREDVRQRNIDFNAVLAEVCAAHARCRWEGGSVFGTPFTPSDVSTRDYFHPSVTGQTRLAQVSWDAGPWAGIVAEAHVGDLDGTAALDRRGWRATVTITVHSETDAALAGATVNGAWTGGYSGTASCKTDSLGRCSVTSGTINKKSTSVTFSVSGITASGRLYDSSSNHDPDGDSTGTAITITKP